MYYVDARHGRLRKLPIGVILDRDEAGGPAQTAVPVRTKIGVIRHVIKHGRTQHLHRQSADPTNHHRHHLAISPPLNSLTNFRRSEFAMIGSPSAISHLA